MLSRLRPLRLPMRYCLAPPQQRLLQSFPNTSVTAKVSVIVSTVAAVGALVSAHYARQARGRQYGPVLQKDLEKKMLNSTYPSEYKALSPYIKRRGLPDIMKIFAAMERQKTLMVCGQRGSGKSAAIRDSLAREERIIVATVGGEDDFDKKIACAITKSLGLHTNADVNHSELVANTLETIQNAKKYQRPPVLVVEVNERLTSSKALEKLLLVLKDWGYDQGLVYPVVVLSTSRAALGLKLTMDVLRAQYVSIGDLHKDEAELYIKELCRELQLVGANDEKAVSKCVENVVDTIGCRLLHLDGVADKVRFLKSTSGQVTLKDLEDVAAKYEYIQLNDSRRALQKLYKTFEFPKEKIDKHFFKKPAGAAVDMDDFCKSVGVDLHNFLERLSEIQPHPFYVDPKTRTVTVGSVFIQKVIDEGYTA